MAPVSLLFKNKIKKILIIEDNPVDLELITRQLKKQKEHVDESVVIESVNNITDAIDRLLNNEYDLITMDGELGNRTSLELFPLLQQLGLLDHVVMITSAPTRWQTNCENIGLLLLDKARINVIAQEIFLAAAA